MGGKESMILFLGAPNPLRRSLGVKCSRGKIRILYLLSLNHDTLEQDLCRSKDELLSVESILKIY